MKWLVFICPLILQVNVFGQQINRQQLRDCLLQAWEHKAALDSLTTQLQGIDKKTPVEESYFGMCTALYCQ